MKKAYILMLSLLLALGVAGCALITQPSAPPEVDEEGQEVEISTPFDVAEEIVVEEEPEIETPAPVVEEIGIEEVEEIIPPEITGYVIANEFVPDWDAIVQRAAELAEFFETNLVAGIALEDAIREMGEPVRKFYDSGPRITTYTFELMTGPTYIPFSDFDILAHENAGINHEWLVTGYIGIAVHAGIWHDRREDFFENISINYGVTGGQGGFVTTTIFVDGSRSNVVIDTTIFVP